LGAVHTTQLPGLSSDSTQFFFMAGPRFTYRKMHRVQPYVQGVFGGVYYTASNQVFGLVPAAPFLPGVIIPILPPEGSPISARLGASQTAFAMAAGLGFDVRLSHRISFRPVAVDYYMTRLRNVGPLGDNRQDNLRASAGFTMNFGGEKPTPP